MADHEITGVNARIRAWHPNFSAYPPSSKGKSKAVPAMTEVLAVWHGSVSVLGGAMRILSVLILVLTALAGCSSSTSISEEEKFGWALNERFYDHQYREAWAFIKEKSGNDPDLMLDRFFNGWADARTVGSPYVQDRDFVAQIHATMGAREAQARVRHITVLRNAQARNESAKAIMARVRGDATLERAAKAEENRLYRENAAERERSLARADAIDSAVSSAVSAAASVRVQQQQAASNAAAQQANEAQRQQRERENERYRQMQTERARQMAPNNQHRQQEEAGGQRREQVAQAQVNRCQTLNPNHKPWEEARRIAAESCACRNGRIVNLSATSFSCRVGSESVWGCGYDSVSKWSQCGQR